MLGMFTGMSCTAGHELIHKKNFGNKVMGTLSFTKYFYSHFLDEHVQGHHRLMCTPEDSATSRKNESLWMFIARECYMGHRNSWNREVRRIRTIYGKDASYFTLIVHNKMTFYFLIHLLIVVIIYETLGLASVKF
jgi:alkane 1-monooxygenase